MQQQQQQQMQQQQQQMQQQQQQQQMLQQQQQMQQQQQQQQQMQQLQQQQQQQQQQLQQTQVSLTNTGPRDTPSQRYSNPPSQSADSHTVAADYQSTLQLQGQQNPSQNFDGRQQQGYYQQQQSYGRQPGSGVTGHAQSNQEGISHLDQVVMGKGRSAPSQQVMQAGSVDNTGTKYVMLLIVSFFSFFCNSVSQ